MKAISERDIDYLASILDHCDRVEETVKRFGSTFESFESDSDYRDSVLMNVFQIGEAANQLTDECKEIFSDIPNLKKSISEKVNILAEEISE